MAYTGPGAFVQFGLSYLVQGWQARSIAQGSQPLVRHLLSHPWFFAHTVALQCAGHTLLC